MDRTCYYSQHPYCELLRTFKEPEKGELMMEKRNNLDGGQQEIIGDKGEASIVGWGCSCPLTECLVHHELTSKRMGGGVQPATVWGTLFNAFITPDEELAPLIEQWKKKFHGHYVIAFHLRGGGCNGQWSDPRFGKCQKEDLTIWWNCLKKKINWAKSKNFSPIVFFSTDWSAMYEEAQKELSPTPTLMVQGQDYHLGKKHTNKENADSQAKNNSNYLPGEERVYLDWWLLGECNETLWSVASTFSLTAALRTGREVIDPFICNLPGEVI